MNKAVSLLNHWDKFDQQFPQATLEDFCRFYLTQNDEQTTDNAEGLLLKTMGRIMSVFGLYHRAAMAQIDMPSNESFFFLNGIAHFGKIKKTDLINYLFFEYTTGMEAINKLLINKLALETPDPNDGRAKLLSLTEKGKRLLAEGYQQSSKVSSMIFKDVDIESVKLCYILLGPIDDRHTKLASHIKNIEFDDIFKKVFE